MNLSAKLVLFRLRQHFSVSTSDHISSTPCLKYPVLYQKSLPLTDNLIYVIDDPAFEVHTSNPGQVMLLFIGTAYPVSLKNHPNVCFIESEVSTAWVFQVLQEIYQIYNAWSEHIFQLMSRTPNINRLLEISAEAIPNSMFVIGMDFTILGTSNLQLDHLKNSVLGSDEATQPIVNALKNDRNYQNAIYHTGYFYYPGNEHAAPSLCVNIQSQGKTTHRLVIQKGRMPLDDTIGFLAEFLAYNVSQILHLTLPPVKSEGHSLHRVFRTLLTNPAADYVEISRELSVRGWLVSHEYQCILIQTGVIDWQNMTIKSICSYLENTIPASCAVDVQENIVFYINLTLSPLSMDEITQKIAGFIRDNLLTASYSRKLMGHFNFYRQYQQAKITMQLGARKRPTAWVHTFNDIALSYCLEQVTRKLPAYMLCHEKLLSIKYQDENNDSRLYETLRCYLENHQNATKTAQALYIHRSTLLYRLDRIRCILKSDLTDPDEILYLLLSYRLMDEEEKH